MLSIAENTYCSLVLSVVSTVWVALVAEDVPLVVSFVTESTVSLSVLNTANGALATAEVYLL